MGDTSLVELAAKGSSELDISLLCKEKIKETEELALN